MARIFLLHWHQAEIEGRAAPLRAAGHSVSLHWSTKASPAGSGLEGSRDRVLGECLEERRSGPPEGIHGREAA